MQIKLLKLQYISFLAVYSSGETPERTPWSNELQRLAFENFIVLDAT